jgi:methylmalonyl-CoA/ethylmalonyl-CoA epimerase
VSGRNANNLATMLRYQLTFDHLGLATKSPAKAIAFLQGLGYATLAPVHDPLQQVNLVLCSHAAMPSVEVIYPDASAGPLESVLATNNEAFYHLCYRSPDVTASLAAISADGHRVLTVSAPKPAILFDGRQVSFYMVRGFGLIEIIQV